jgi:hypothetical protein
LTHLCRQGRARGRTPRRYSSNPFVTPMSKGTGCSAPRFGQFNPVRAPVHTVHEAGSAQSHCGRAWKLLPLSEFDPWTVQPVEELLYRLSYTGSLAPTYCCLLPAPNNRMGGRRWLGEALHCKPEGHGFNFRWGNWLFH